MKKKLIRLIKVELITIVILIIFIAFKAKTDNIFFPKLSIMILLSILGLIILGLGTWFEKL
jgi:hypothetical protein